MLKTSVVLLAAMIAMNLQAVRADQPRMQEALAHLREARAALAKAEHNKNGHRERAIELLNQTIAEVEAGISQAR
ncbi:MAG: hypothetical protein H0X40_13645 [Chthoniobacterales bacterium]|nr:hypothetical protein [Chthoniobacterales bacterium]